jgi:rod shape-determining protein MreC
MERTGEDRRFFSAKASFTSFGFFAALSLILITVDHRIQLMDPVRSELAQVSHLAHSVLSMPLSWTEDLLENFHSKSRLQKENSELSSRLRKLEIDLLRLESLAQENASLRQMLGAKDFMQVPSRLFDVRRVISDGFTQYFVIDGGSDEGVKVGMPVVSDKGLAGQIARVSKASSLVQLIQDKNMQIPVLFKDAKIYGILQGAGDGSTLVSRDLPFTEKIRAGDEVVTSGLDGIYPRGIPVGIVLSTEPSKSGIFSLVHVASQKSIQDANSILVLFVDPNRELDESGDEDDGQQRRRAVRR